MACFKKRNGAYYVQYYLGTKQKRVSLQTDSYHLAKAKLAKLELNLAQGRDALLPTRTPIADVLTRYVALIPEQLADCVEFNQPQEKPRHQFNHPAGQAL